jgi:hypothetical protein
VVDKINKLTIKCKKLKATFTHNNKEEQFYYKYLNNKLNVLRDTIDDQPFKHHLIIKTTVKPVYYMGHIRNAKPLLLNKYLVH